MKLVEKLPKEFHHIPLFDFMMITKLVPPLKFIILFDSLYIRINLIADIYQILHLSLFHLI